MLIYQRVIHAYKYRKHPNIGYSNYTGENLSNPAEKLDGLQGSPRSSVFESGLMMKVTAREQEYRRWLESERQAAAFSDVDGVTG